MYRHYNGNNSDKYGKDMNDQQYVCLPYVLTNKCNLQITYRSYNSLNNIYTKLKTPLETLNKTHVVYKIKCTKCDGVYIRQKNYLKTGLDQYRRLKLRNNETYPKRRPKFY